MMVNDGKYSLTSVTLGNRLKHFDDVKPKIIL